MESEIGYMLQWINEGDTFQINVRIIWDHLIIETNALSDEDRIEAMVGSCKIFEQIQSYSRSPRQSLKFCAFCRVIPKTVIICSEQSTT